MSSTAQPITNTETAQSSTRDLDVWYKNKCYYCSRELFLSQPKTDTLYTHTYCYWLDIIQFSHHICDDSSDDSDDDEREPEPYSLTDEMRLESVYNIPKGSLARFKATQEYCVFVK